ncbi:hypothetical protein DFP73DRAFT_563255 [Morchella snyderi]|nr:hypothetical protein DFP73DRAFT_563255 [Morchella snyderi]
MPSSSNAQQVVGTQNIVQGAAVPEQQIHNPLDPRLLGNIPFSYTANKLREWGDVYLFNSSTADAFVRAIAISPAQSSRVRDAHVSPNDLQRALSDFSISSKSIKQDEEEEQDEYEPNTTKQLVKVRIIPQSRLSRPFYMQKYFSIRKSSSCRISKHISSPRHHIKNREEHYRRANVEILQNVVNAKTQRRSVSKHIPDIEYALHRAPLLAAILLSEHVKRGATVEIPLLFPEVWEDVVEWMYTGSSGSNVSAKVRKTIEYLGGTI